MFIRKSCPKPALVTTSAGVVLKMTIASLLCVYNCCLLFGVDPCITTGLIKPDGIHKVTDGGGGVILG